jgi:hypothetical protein
MRAATDPAVLNATSGLVGYLRDLVRAGTARIRDLNSFAMTVWLGQLPDGVDTSHPHGELVLAVDYEPPPLRPALPAVLIGRVYPAEPDDPASVPVLADQQPSDDPPDAERYSLVRAFRDWLPTWHEWATRELASRPRRELYETLAQHARLLSQQDDEFEAVLGVGLLTWAPTGSPAVARHILTRRVDLRLDRRTARVCALLAEEAPTRLEDHEFLDSDYGHSAERTLSIRERLAALAPHPLAEETSDALQQWRDTGLDSAVEFDPEWGARPRRVRGPG